MKAFDKARTGRECRLRSHILLYHAGQAAGLFGGQAAFTLTRRAQRTAPGSEEPLSLRHRGNRDLAER